MTGGRGPEMLRPMITSTEASVVDSKREVIEPGDVAWNAARRAFDLAVDQRPALIAVPADEGGVVRAVRHAREHGLRVVAQCAGRDAARLGPLDDALLLRTTRLAGVEIDARAHRARIRAGARWADVSHPASFLGLAPAAGFDRGASVVGTVLGDGMGWLARRHGVAAASVTAVDFVTADGELARADDDIDVARALRDGGVVTALEIALHPADDLYAGALFFSFDRAAEVLHAWREWTEAAAPEITSVGRLMQFGDGPEVAELVRGRSLVVIEAAHLGTEAEGAELLRPLRELRPELDTFTIVPPSALGHLHMAPEEPVARLADDGLVGALPAAAIDDLVAVAGSGSGSPLASVELRHASGALETLERGFFTHAAGHPTDTASAAAIEAQLALVAAALAPYGAFPARLGG
jgi:FAD/FMN-containing dehydrogenase